MRACINDECQHPLADDTKFCTECGHRQPARVWDITTAPVSLAKTTAPPQPQPQPQPQAPPPQPPPPPRPAPGDQLESGDPGSPGGQRRRRGRGRVLLAALAAAAVLAGLWFGVRAVGAATAVWRTCALQPDAVAAVTHWQPSSTTAGSGTDPYPNTHCTYVDRATGTGGTRNTVTITTAGTEAGTTPGEPQRCLSGGHWGGRGYVCQVAAGAAITDPDWRSVSMTGVRLNGADTYGVDLTCIEPSPPGASLAGVSRDLSEQCLTTLTGLMTAVADKLGIRPDATVQQQPVNVDLLAAAAAAAGEGATPPVSDPNPTPPNPTPPDNTPTTSQPTPQPPTADPAPDPKATLDQLAAASRLTMDGHWAVQLASKSDGIIDRTQTTATGSHTFRYADILAEYEHLVAAFPDVPVSVIHGSAISSIPRNKRLYVTIADPGGLGSRAEVLTWCKGRFPNLGDKARLNVCYPRKLQLD